MYINTDHINRLIRDCQEAQRDYGNATASLENTKKHLADFVILNRDNIEGIDLDSFHEQCEEAQWTIDGATERFNEAKNRLIGAINQISLD